MQLAFTLTPSEDDLASLQQGLIAFNSHYFSKRDNQPVALFVRDTNNKVIGGLCGEIFLNSLYIKYLWLDESLRGAGLGKKLMARIEKEAMQRAIPNIYLDTFSFQAPQFYEKMGFIEVGRYSNFPETGVDKIFFQKNIK